MTSPTEPIMEAEGVLERVARARYESHVVQSRNVGGELRAWKDYHPEYKAAEIEAMRAALAALVPPSVEMVAATAELLSKLRGCREPDSASHESFPCSFCRWSLDQNEYGTAHFESGCIAWAEAILTAAIESLTGGGE